MKKSKLTTHQRAKLLVQNILSKNTLVANQIFRKLIQQAQQERQILAKRIVMQQDELDDSDDLDEGDDDSGDDSLDDEESDDEESDEESDDEEEGDQQEDGLSNDQVQDKVDDDLQIQCQINAKRITYLFDIIAQLKKGLQDKDLDPNSKQYIKGDVSISYYSDKLQEFQGKTNPGVDQGKLQQALDKIQQALNQLKQQIGISSDDVDSDVDTPDQVSGDQEGQEDQTDQSEDLQEQSDQQGQQEESEQQEQQDQQEQSDQQLQ